MLSLNLCFSSGVSVALTLGMEPLLLLCDYPEKLSMDLVRGRPMVMTGYGGYE